MSRPCPGVGVAGQSCCVFDVCRRCFVDDYRDGRAQSCSSTGHVSSVNLSEGHPVKGVYSWLNVLNVSVEFACLT